MAWHVAAYGITVAILMIAAAFVIGVKEACRSFRHLDATVDHLAKDTEETLQQCKQLAEEAKAAIVVVREGVEGFSTLAEGARALGEAAQEAAQGITSATALCRDRLSAVVTVTSEYREKLAADNPKASVVAHHLWKWWINRSAVSGTKSDSCKPSGPNADPSQGE